MYKLPAAPKDEFCEGWEEIASFLKRSARWCQRHQKKIPVFRDAGGRPMMNKESGAKYRQQMQEAR